METIVCKFGGSSVANAQQVRKVERIVAADPARRIVVVSAPGKRDRTDEKITDILIACHALAAEGRDITSRFEPIRRRFHELADDLAIGRDMDPWINEVETDIREGADYSAVVSRGEYLGARMIARFLGFEFVDARDLIRFSDETTVDRNATDRMIRARIEPGRSYVVPGFYGALADGRVQLFTRGGSDISASLVARGIGAKLYENWTDVSGLLAADPRIVDSPDPIPRISYTQLRDLAYLGANVFHDEAVAPVADAGIPINIRNTNEPDHPGTVIVGAADQPAAATARPPAAPAAAARPPAEPAAAADQPAAPAAAAKPPAAPAARTAEAVIGVAGKTGYAGLLIRRSLLSKDGSAPARIRTSLGNRGVVVAHLSQGGDSILAVVELATFQKALRDYGPDLQETICAELSVDSVDQTGAFALVGAAGTGLLHRPFLIAGIFTAFAHEDLVPEFCSAGYSPDSFVVAVREDRYADAVRAVYRGTRR